MQESPSVDPTAEAAGSGWGGVGSWWRVAAKYGGLPEFEFSQASVIGFR
jgi:hypothetical protein